MKKNITSIGEILFDIYGTKKEFGGAPFNFIYHVNKLMGSACFVTAVGDDDNGKLILEFLDRHNFSNEYIGIKNGIPTGAVLVKLNKNKEPEYHIKTNVAYDYISLSEDQKESILEKSGLLYFGTLCQRNSVARETIKSFFDSGLIKFCDLNLRQSFYTEEVISDSLFAADILKLNIGELKTVCEMFDIGFVEPQNSVKELMNKFKIDYIALTKGEDGAELFSKSESVSNKHDVTSILDTVGAGDAYSAVLAVGILYNNDIKKINRLANQFASEICNVKGAIPLDEDIYKSYREQLKNE